MVLALEFWSPPFRFSTNASATLLVFVVKLGVIPQFGLQRHLAFKGAPKALQGVLANHKPAGWWLAQTTNQLLGGLQATNQLVGGLQTTNQLVGGLQTANQLVGGLQTANQLVGGLQTANQLGGCLQATNQLVAFRQPKPPW